jgi:hypothetical protein
VTSDVDATERRQESACCAHQFRQHAVSNIPWLRGPTRNRIASPPSGKCAKFHALEKSVFADETIRDFCANSVAYNSELTLRTLAPYPGQHMKHICFTGLLSLALSDCGGGSGGEPPPRRPHPSPPISATGPRPATFTPSIRQRSHKAPARPRSTAARWKRRSCWRKAPPRLSGKAYQRQ